MLFIQKVMKYKNKKPPADVFFNLLAVTMCSTKTIIEFLKSIHHTLMVLSLILYGLLIGYIVLSYNYRYKKQVYKGK